jgi:hypothetical protein
MFCAHEDSDFDAMNLDAGLALDLVRRQGA